MMIDALPLKGFNPSQATEKEPLQDHCGIIAAFCEDDTPFFLTGLAGLIQLQTRGYDGAGVAYRNSQGGIFQYKGEGRIGDAFTSEIVAAQKNAKATTWIYETRYGTNGAAHIDNVQPIIRTHSLSNETFAVVHNGQFSNDGGHVYKQQSDTVDFADQLARSTESTWDKRIVELHKKKNGAWSAAISTPEGLYLLRDPRGIRPLSYGRKTDPFTNKTVWIAASETAALKAMGVEEFYEVIPDSVIKISKSGIQKLREPSRNLNNRNGTSACIFENVYIGDGPSAVHAPRHSDTEIRSAITITQFREACGEIMAREAPLPPLQVDIAIGIPGTGIAGGRSFAEKLGIPYIQAIKDLNPQDEARTFMTPDTSDIYRRVLTHFSFDEHVLKGMRVVIIDDSLVRGNINKGLISLLKQRYGATEVHSRILCPPIDKSCYLGINTRNTNELIAARLNGDIMAIQREIEADSLAFLSDRGLLEATGKFDGFCLGCMVNHRPPVDSEGNLIPSQTLFQNVLN